jgi:N-methylhydantoinase B/acetone carboxylase alpha subunit
MSYGLFSRGFREEVVPGYGFTGDSIQGGGIYSAGPLKGERWMLSTFEISGQGLGASAVKDGLNWGYAMWNPESDLGDVETWELFQGGIPYLSRKVKPNTPGHGKYRGGANYAGVAFIANSEKVEFFAGREGLMAKNTNLEEIFQQKQNYPLGDPDPSNGEFERFLKADITRIPIGTIYPIALENYDIIHFSESGGPGYGDPLERKLENVKKDLDEGLYTPDIVKNVYGVVANFDDNKKEWEIDNEATRIQKQRIMDERKSESLSFEEFWKKERDRIINGDFYEAVTTMYSESLRLSTKWGREFREFWNLDKDFQLEVK